MKNKIIDPNVMIHSSNGREAEVYLVGKTLDQVRQVLLRVLGWDSFFVH